MDKQTCLELFNFVEDTSHPQVQQEALKYITGLTATDDGKKFLLSIKTPKSFTALMHRTIKSSSGKKHEITVNVHHSALICLVNMSSEKPILQEIIECEVLVPTLVDSSTQFNDVKAAEYALMLLNNLSLYDKSAQFLLQMNTHSQGLWFKKLVEHLVFNTDHQNTIFDPLNTFISSIIMNLSQFEFGRKVTLASPHNVSILVPFAKTIKPRNLALKKNILGFLKNLCFDSGNHDALLSADIDLANHLVFLLRGNEQLSTEDMDGMSAMLISVPPNHQRDPDAESRLLVLQCLLLLAANKSSRNVLRKTKVYPIIREAEKTETNEEVRDSMYNLVELLMLIPSEEEFSAIKEENKNQNSPKTTAAPAKKPLPEIEEI